ncbi:MAG TPA: hypothetical protein H9829_03390 [Candidatus Tetragenococcus pullicola]|nr:hypothetical protein [Candidatus Tetragenococcus pullicola]
MKKENKKVQTVLFGLQKDLEQEALSIEEIEVLLVKTNHRLHSLSKLSFDPQVYQEEIQKITEQYTKLQEQIKQNKRFVLRELEQLNRKQSNSSVYTQPELASSYEFYY